jgi:hypothetical protein
MSNIYSEQRMRNFLLYLVFALGAIVLLASFGVGQVPDVEAVVNSVPRVAFPKEARETGLEGVVTVGVAVDAAGRVTSVGMAAGPDWVCPNVTRSDVVAMREAAKAAAAKATFEPAAKDGQAVASQSWVKVEFVDPWPKPEGMGVLTAGPVGVKKAETGGMVSPPTGSTPGQPVPKILEGGVLNGTATSLPRPSYPPAARAVHAMGAVQIQVVIDEEGKVFWAHWVSGHPLLVSAARISACNSTFTPTLLSGKPVKVTGIITYNFVT